LVVFVSVTVIAVEEGSMPFGWAIKKDISPFAMAMEVDYQFDWVFLVEVLHQLLGVIHRRVDQLIGMVPSSVHIHSCKGASLVAVYDSVHIHHRDDFENELSRITKCG
jgi:hypothetical protein